MIRVATSRTAVLAGVLISIGAVAQEVYQLDPDSLPQKGVPQGNIEGPIKWTSNIFPGTVRDYWA